MTSASSRTTPPGRPGSAVELTMVGHAVSPTAFIRSVAVCLLMICAQRSGADLVFEGMRGRAFEIYRINEEVGETSVRNLTNHFANDYLPDWSRDGERIAFSSDRDNYPGDIFVMDSHGGSQRNLTNHPAWDSHPSWSPDGTRIAFSSHRNGRPDVFVMDADGGALRQLTEHPSVDHEPAWSPDGQWIAFASRRDGSADIHLVSPDGGPITRLTDHPTSENNAAWSPDGRHLAFTSDRDRKKQDVYVMKSDGAGAQRVTDGGGFDLYPAWSPDGERIAYSSGPGGRAGMHLRTVNVDTREDERLTLWVDKWGPGADRHPSWLPTGLDVDTRADHRALMWGWLKQLTAGRRKL